MACTKQSQITNGIQKKVDNSVCRPKTKYLSIHELDLCVQLKPWNSFETGADLAFWLDVSHLQFQFRLNYVQFWIFDIRYTWHFVQYMEYECYRLQYFNWNRIRIICLFAYLVLFHFCIKIESFIAMGIREWTSTLVDRVSDSTSKPFSFDYEWACNRNIFIWQMYWIISKLTLCFSIQIDLKTIRFLIVLNDGRPFAIIKLDTLA